MAKEVQAQSGFQSGGLRAFALSSVIPFVTFWLFENTLGDFQSSIAGLPQEQAAVSTGFYLGCLTFCSLLGSLYFFSASREMWVARFQRPILNKLLNFAVRCWLSVLLLVYSVLVSVYIVPGIVSKVDVGGLKRLTLLLLFLGAAASMMLKDKATETESGNG